MSKEFTHAVFIGRFQPLHIQHLKIIKQGLEVADRLILVIGSIDTAPSIKNPWTFEERREMVDACLTPKERNRVDFIGVRDYFYSEPMWLSEVQSQVATVVGTDSERICLLGKFTDHSSDYLNCFQQWEFVQAKCKDTYHATDVRNDLLTKKTLEECVTSKDKWQSMLPLEVTNYIIDWAYKDVFKYLREEFDAVKADRDAWSESPYPPVFVTTDTVVIKSGHILVVTRRLPPGKGLWALPGGYLKENKSLQYSAIRELKEETRIGVDAVILNDKIKEVEVFDYPGRDPRGRTITHAFLIDLGSKGDLPRVRGGDDASRAAWIPIREVLENPARFFADHVHILYHLLMTKRWS